MSLPEWIDGMDKRGIDYRRRLRGLPSLAEIEQANARLEKMSKLEQKLSKKYRQVVRVGDRDRGKDKEKENK